MNSDLTIVQTGDGLRVWGSQTIPTEIECTICGWRKPVSVGNQTHRALAIALAHRREQHN